MQPRLDGKLVLLYTLLFLQVLIVMVYVATTPPSELTASMTHTSVSFVKFEEPQQEPKQRPAVSKKIPIYQTINGEITINDVKTFTFFEAYNHTVCWKHGVDDQKMRSSEDLEKCICIHGWHGSDCGQPEVVWRAIMASKQNIELRHRKLARRIIHTFFLYEYNSAIAEVIVEELYDVVDLFVICDFSNAEENFHHKLLKGLLRQRQKKILYVNVASKLHKPARVVSKYVWEKLKTVVRNLRDDDIHITTEPEQILNSRALMFLKVYNGWPQPIGFRLRWSVYGFFWQHPLKTTITVGACTIGLMREAYQSNSIMLDRLEGGDLSERDSLGLVIGDLNHYGGWYCYLCQSPSNIITSLQNKVKSKEIEIEKTIDVPFIEDLIGSGLWLDGKTTLLRVSKSRDPYFAPEIILNNTWKYDWLVENFYAKLDYY
ncbi:beta-1,4-mannosyl-glycoprotein 4-beta-N-acetylglucosaminyltransferase isoform X1 [Ceratina calcarata]|uniref:Beta-1,4-mannosyl-glycoprotein 4-beta-N-acetylglucosaminyltransferase isoform X1 n=1 Tax=Ceratina calcarata TaxID=156304 RepID=A0AAJ7N3E6_9HYME|nr:beta-1,4-mannosyl-glycoprotein 4-beta-N-acetylglucosaminyltransferase isoform X1 [Ceratina calcarata]XP_017875649.1 beta-1,4-mannosyl-glycoprotein 4-beta-N-acetylglucosaminyltransferase isoform X1 [Ceratina calcarata]